MRRRPARFILRLSLSLILSGLTVAVATPALAYIDIHFSIRRSTPAVNEVLEVSPKRVQVWFSQVPADVVSQLTLTDAEKKPIQAPKSIIDKETMSMAVDLKDPLPPGAYVMQWRGAGDDGHVMSGEIKFSIAPKAVR